MRIARLLSAESVRTMTRNRLTPQQIAAADFFPKFFDTHGWGYGVAVTAENYGWDGGFGTSWSNDPQRNLVSIVMTQSTDFLFGGGLEAYLKAVYTATAA